MANPKVSVIVPVYNCRASLERTFRSVLDQTLPAGQVEIIAVDDGSTDGSGEELERLAAGHPGFTVLHHETGSGGPGKPRNTGLAAATGEYVFFLDADDHLAPEALARCVAMADENGTDVVVPKYVGIGRKVNPHLFRRTVPFTTIQDAVPNLYGSITVLKLYRRSLLDHHGIRFPENVLSGEDQIFAVRAYFEAKGVSVLADYDCYYWVDRDDGTSALQLGGAPAEHYFPEIETLLAYVTGRTEPGAVRDRLLRRHFAIEIFSRFDPRYQHFTEAERQATKAAVRDLVRRYGNPTIMGGLSPYMRLLDHLLRHGHDALIDQAARVHAEDPPPIVVDGEHAYLAYPGFRDAALSIPDEVFRLNGPLSWRHGLTGLEWRGGRLLVHGYAFVERVDRAEQREELVLREREGEREYRIPFVRAAASAEGRPQLTAEIDPATVAGGAPLPPGRWDAFAVVQVQGRTHEGRIVAREGAQDVLPGARVAPVASGLPVLTPYLTKNAGALALHAGGTGGLAGPAAPARIEASGDGLRLTAELATAGDAPVTVAVLLRHRGDDTVHTVPAALQPLDGAVRVTADLPPISGRKGVWDVSYEITLAGAHGRLRAPAAESAAGVPGVLRTVKGNLSLEHGGAKSAGGRLRRLFRRG
ncbi:glycosyltransferase family 2 protein [Actinomadura macrotermitis]|uniref:Undecaprenyl-phosphate 4-deoxy-4-formamido-L-arabinose transferase n=1 Tax=Actinomadura macrotermitis TaxID=2585200 RepID=A0A7K0C125_9ACTN|nr:glycosyltransferase family 2 protein [Actinomadura macrotermitis]MQY07173.1 Undecaprenyl-phosphate 4-deoxy-4-formamido-L-arabinose transferase [Actinomadura macrotermitis]